MLIPAVLRAERLELRLLSLRVMACMMHSTGTGSSSGSGGSGGRGRVFFFSDSALTLLLAVLAERRTCPAAGRPRATGRTTALAAARRPAGSHKRLL